MIHPKFESVAEAELSLMTIGATSALFSSDCGREGLLYAAECLSAESRLSPELSAAMAEAAPILAKFESMSLPEWEAEAAARREKEANEKANFAAAFEQITGTDLSSALNAELMRIAHREFRLESGMLPVLNGDCATIHCRWSEVDLVWRRGGTEWSVKGRSDVVHDIRGGEYSKMD